MRRIKANVDPWSRLQAELDAWAEASIEATLWWRDDDAFDDTSALRTLLALTDGLPVSLAVVPEPAVDRLAERLSHYSDITVLQHGFAHRNHAPAEEKKTEYGRHRLGSEVSVEIMRGKDRLRYLFPKSIRSIFVPPWNRMDDRHIPLLSAHGFEALSTFGPAKPNIELQQINTHIDIIDWRGTRGFVGEAVALVILCDHLSKWRDSEDHTNRAIGLMTHHLDHDKETWRFLERLIEVTSHHPACNWIAVELLLEQT